jgi:REP element-mobilizing transposase RayT
MSDDRHTRHNGSAWLDHSVCPVQARRVILEAAGDPGRKEVCCAIAKRYAIAFVALGTAPEPVHCLGPSVPSARPTQIVQLIQSLTARASLRRVASGKKRLEGGACWSQGSCLRTVGWHGPAAVMRQ